jgi:hypothetical protein
MPDIEQWLPVEGWPYEVSDLGRVRRAVATPGTRKGKILKPTKNVRWGYLYVMLNCVPRKQNRRVHVMVCEAFHGPRPSPEHDAAHKDGNRTNNVATNLKWATRTENMADAMEQGTFVKGADHWSAKLIPDDVCAIRRRVALGENMHRLAEEFGLCASQVCRISKRQTWAWLPD